MTHPKTMAFATLLNSRHKWDEQVVEAMEALFSDYSDEKKADLYAMVQERVKHNMTFEQMANIIDVCLRMNDAYVAGGRPTNG